MKKYLFICLLSSHLGCQEPQSIEEVEERLIVDGGQAGNYDRPYSLNPIPIHPRAPEPSSCDDQGSNKENEPSFTADGEINTDLRAKSQTLK